MTKTKRNKNHNHKKNHKINNYNKNMDYVKIKRVKRNKKKASTKEKVLAGLGVGGTLLGGIGAVSPQQKPTQFVREQEQQKEEGTKTSKVKETLKRIFGIQKAKAMEEELPLEEVPAEEAPVEETPVEEPEVIAPEPEVIAPEPEVIAPEPEVIAPEPLVGTFKTQVTSPGEPLFGEGASVSDGGGTSGGVTATINTSGLTVTPDINNALTGTVTVSGQQQRLSVLPDGRIFNDQGQEVTNTFSSGDADAVRNAFATAPAPTPTPSSDTGGAAGGTTLSNIIITAANTPYESMTSEAQTAFRDYFSGGANAEQIPNAFTGDSAFAMGLGLGPAGSPGTTTVGSNGHNYIVNKDGNWVDLGFPPTAAPIAPEILAGIPSNFDVLYTPNPITPITPTTPITPITPTTPTIPSAPVSGLAGLVTTPSPSSLAQAYPQAAQLFVQNTASQYMSDQTLSFWQGVINQYGQDNANRLFQTILSNPNTYNVTSSNWNTLVQSAANNLGIVGYTPGTSAAGAIGLIPTFQTNPTVTLPYDTTRPLNPSEYATLETAQAIAKLLGGTVVTASFYGGSVPQYGIEVDGRYVGNAGLLANSMVNNSPVMMISMLHNWGFDINSGPLWEAAKSQLESPLLANSATGAQAGQTLPASLLPYYVPDEIRFAQPSQPSVVVPPALAPGAATTTSYSGSYGSLSNINIQRTDSGLTVTFTDPSTNKVVTLNATSDTDLYNKMQSYYQPGNNQSLTVFYALDQVRGNWDNYTATPKPGPQPVPVVTSGGAATVNALETEYTIGGKKVTAQLVSLPGGGMSITLFDSSGQPLVNPQTGQPIRNVVVSDIGALANLEFAFRQRSGDANSLISGALSGVLGTWNSSNTGASFTTPSGTPQVWGDAYGNRATYVGELGGTVYYDAASGRLLLDRGGSELLVLTGNIAFNQSSVQSLQKTLLNTELYGGGGSDLPSGVPAERQYSSGYNMLSQLGTQGIQQTSIQPGAGRSLQGSGEFFQAYQGAQVPFTLTVGSTSSGQKVYTFTLTVNGQPVTRTFIGTDELNKFLIPSFWTEDTFLALSPEEKVLATAVINARLKYPEIGLGISGLPEPSTNHNQTITYQQADGSWVTNTNYISPVYLSFRQEAEYFQKMFPGSQIVEGTLPGANYPGAQINLDPNDSRRAFELVLPDGTRMNVGEIRDSMYTSGGTTYLFLLPSQAGQYFEPPAGSNVLLGAFSPSVSAGTNIAQAPVDISKLAISHITIYDSNGSNTNGVISPGFTIEIGGSGLSAYRNRSFALRVRPYGAPQGTDLAISQATITDNKITLKVPQTISADFPSQGFVLLVLDGNEYVFRTFTFSRADSGATTPAGAEIANTITGTTTANIDAGAVDTSTGTINTGTSVTTGSVTVADQQQISQLNERIVQLQNRIDYLSSQLTSQSTSAQLQTANLEITSLRTEINRLRNLLSSAQGTTQGGQVQTFGSATQIAQGLQMPLGYPASTRGPGLQMPPGYPASQGYQAPAVAGAQTMATYEVKKGDTLWKIAKKYYGDGKKWRKILEANPNCLSKPSNTKTLKIGVELTIPKV